MKRKKTTVKTAQMAAPGRPKDSAKRDDIVRSASALFFKDGYELTSMDAVAKKANVSKLTIYSHFADKYELFKEVVRQRCDKRAMPGSFMALAQKPVKSALLHIGANMVNLLYSPDSIRLQRIMQAEAAHHPKVVQIFFAAGPKRVRDAFSDLLHEWNRQGQLAVPDVPVATAQFFSLLKGEMLMKTLLLLTPPPYGARGPQTCSRHSRFLSCRLPASNNLRCSVKSTRSRLILLFFILCAVIAGCTYLFLHRGEESTDDAAIDGHVITLSPKISGYVISLNIDDNQVVKAGDVLLEIDPTDYTIRRDHAQAALEAAEAAATGSIADADTTNISAPSNLDAARAQVTSAEANWEKAFADLKRMQRLNNEARSQEQLDQAIAAEKAANSNMQDARAKLRSAKTAPNAIAAALAQRDKLQAQVKQAQSDLAQAENDLINTKVIAPVDGRITKRAVERGDYVQPGQQLGSLVGTELWVTANFKETQLESMHPGQRVKITVDAFPHLDLDAKVDSIQSGTGSFFSTFPPENATGNFVKIIQRVPVKLVFNQAPDPALTLGPGMSVIATVYTHGDLPRDGNNQNEATKE